MQRAYWRSMFIVILLSISTIDVSKCDYIAIVKCLSSISARNRVVLQRSGIHCLDHSLRVVRGRRLLVNLKIMG